MSQKAEILAEHYQKTFDLTMDLWQKRSKTFVMLLIVVGFAALLTLNISQTESLLLDLIVKFTESNEARRAELQASFPFGLVQSIFLMAILYLMILLYHSTATIHRHYSYLEKVETEIRQELQLAEEAASFTREGTFYQRYPPGWGKSIFWCYALMFGILLATFLWFRIAADLESGNFFILLIDCVMAIATLCFYYAYVTSRPPI